jgi:phosphatidylserine/phosphatidylglycerophosphate/cardiolipin synthase-like enzyme
MERVFELIAGAQHAVLFLAFDPGNNSILDAAAKALAKNPDLFVRGALTSSQRASNFSEALHQGGETDQDGGAHTGIAVVGEPGKPKKKGAKPKLKPDYRAIPAGSVTKNDAFGAWEAELAKYGFAIIHNKIVVVDPFSENCTVVAGSHNLGYRASHNNDENLVIVRGHRGLAEAYACHVLDLYDHYAWRYWLKEKPEIFGKPLEGDDKWQERYIIGPDVKSPELRFWLSAATGGTATASPRASGLASAAKTRGASGKQAATASAPTATRKRKRKKPAEKKMAKKASAKKRKARGPVTKKRTSATKRRKRA